MQMNWAHLQETEKEYHSISIAVEFTENIGNGKPIEIWSRDVESDMRQVQLEGARKKGRGQRLLEIV